MKQGLSLLRQREVNSISSELHSIMQIEDIPPIFKLFISTYNLGYEMLLTERVKRNNLELEFFTKVILFENYLINNEEYNATIDLVFNIPDLIIEYNKFINIEDNWHKEGLMKVGLLFHGDVLLVGISQEKKDEIWRYGNGLLQTTFCKLDNNIFSLFSRLKQDIDGEQLEYLNVKEPNLYKNWGEDFWRVRED